MDSPVPGSISGAGNGSGAGLLTIATQGLDLITQQARSLLITPGERHGQGELQLFQLVFPFALASGLEMAARRGRGLAGCGGLGGGPNMSRRGLLPGMQTVRESHG